MRGVRLSCSSNVLNFTNATAVAFRARRMRRRSIGIVSRFTVAMGEHVMVY